MVVLTSRITFPLLNIAEKVSFTCQHQRPVEIDTAAKRSSLALLPPVAGFFLVQVSGCTIQLVTY